MLHRQVGQRVVLLLAAVLGAASMLGVAPPPNPPENKYEAIERKTAPILKALRQTVDGMGMPKGIRLRVSAPDEYRLEWLVEIGSTDGPRVSLKEMAAQVGLNDHDRRVVLDRWSDWCSKKILEETCRVMARVRPDTKFYPETELKICVWGSPYPTTKEQREQSEHNPAGFYRTYCGSRLLGSRHGPDGKMEYPPTEPTGGQVAATIRLDRAVVKAGEQLTGVVVFQNTSSNRVHLPPAWIDDTVRVAADGVGQPPTRMAVGCVLPEPGAPLSLPVEPSASREVPISIRVSAGPGGYILKPGKYKIFAELSAQWNVTVRCEPVAFEFIGQAEK
ncbi:MAG: hypothetical protein ACREJO_04450 [Phycisphaerales bacterium]